MRLARLSLAPFFKGSSLARASRSSASTPEIAALEFFWPRLEPGAMVLLDDYAFPGLDAHRVAMDTFADAHDVAIACLPTGQGLMIRPPVRQV